MHQNLLTNSLPRGIALILLGICFSTCAMCASHGQSFDELLVEVNREWVNDHPVELRAKIASFLQRNPDHAGALVLEMMRALYYNRDLESAQSIEKRLITIANGQGHQSDAEKLFNELVGLPGWKEVVADPAEHERVMRSQREFSKHEFPASYLARIFSIAYETWEERQMGGKGKRERYEPGT